MELPKEKIVERPNARRSRIFVGELTELGAGRRAKHLVTTPREIARSMGLDVGIVRKWLSRATGKWAVRR